MGDVLFETEEYESAEAAYRSAMDSDPNDAGWGWSRLGFIWHKQGSHFEQAEEAYRKAIDMGVRAASVFYNLGLILEIHSHQPTAAGEMFIEALRLDRSTSTLLLRSLCHDLVSSTDDVAKGESLAQRGLELVPDDRGLQAAYARALLIRNAWPEAERVIEAWLVGAESWYDGSELFLTIIETGRIGAVLRLFEKVGADERIRPVYVALQAVDAQSSEFLSRIAPEVRAIASLILRRIAPQLASDDSARPPREA